MYGPAQQPKARLLCHPIELAMVVVVGVGMMVVEVVVGVGMVVVVVVVLQACMM